MLGAPCSNCASFIVCANRTGTPANTFSPLTQAKLQHNSLRSEEERRGDRPWCTHFLHCGVTPILGQLCLCLSEEWVALCAVPHKVLSGIC